MNITRVTDNIYRGQHPLNDDDFKKLKELGVTLIINLERGWFEFFHRRLNKEVDLAIKYGIYVEHIELGNVFPPSKDDCDAVLDILRAGAFMGKVYVHCLHGVDRTGFVCAAYRVKVQQWPVDAAIEEMLALGFHQWSYWWWIKTLKKYLKGD